MKELIRLKVANRNLDSIYSEMQMLVSDVSAFNDNPNAQIVIRTFFTDLSKRIQFIRTFAWKAMNNDKTITRDDLPTEFFTSLDFAVSAFDNFVAINEVKASVFQECCNSIMALTQKIFARIETISQMIAAREKAIDDAEKLRNNAVTISQADVIALFNNGRMCADILKRYQLNGPIQSTLKLQDFCRYVVRLSESLYRKF